MEIIYWLCCIQSYSQVSWTLKKGDAYRFHKHADIDSEQGVVNILLCNKGDKKLTVFLPGWVLNWEFYFFFNF